MTSQRTKGILGVVAIVLALIAWGFWPRDHNKRGQRRVGDGDSLEAFLEKFLAD